jgi:hypothetical protein
MNLTAYHLIPPHMMEKMHAYVNCHAPVGNFLQAIISNNLKMAVLAADPVNMSLIPIYAYWFYMEAAPSRCQGSPEAYRRWIGEKVNTGVLT